MAQAGDCAGFTVEARAGVAAKARGQHLDRHSAVESRISRTVDVTHAASPDPQDEEVGPDLLARE
jgi:hypothetical protein